MVLDFKEFWEGHACAVKLDPHNSRRNSKDEDGQAGDENGALSVIAVVNEIAHTELNGGNHRGQRCERQSEEEHRRHDQWPNGATRRLSEHLWKGEERDGR